MDEPRFYEFGEFRLDIMERVLWRGGEMLVLPRKIFETLYALVRKNGHIVKREELMTEVWVDTFVEEGNLSVNISFLRKTLGKDFIETIPRRGYRFSANVKVILDENADSIAVLPFQNVIGDDATDYLSDGLTETLINKLSQLPQLKVIAQHSAFHYKGKDIDPYEVGQTLRVQTLLMGRVRRLGDNVIINVELVDTHDGTQIWGEQYNRRFTDIFAVQAEITREITERLRLRLTGEDEKRLAKRYTQNPEAYQAYLKGRFFAAKWTQEGFRKGIEYFNEAIAIDPNYALAYDGLAYCYYNSFYIPFKESMTCGREFARCALEIDPALAEAHTSVGLINTWLDYDRTAAETEFKRAIELNPNYAFAHLWYGVHLSYSERFDESIAELKRAIELDPLSAEANTGLGVVLFYARRYDEADEQFRKTLELEPKFWFARLHLARVYEQKGDFPKAIAELEKTRLIEGASTEVLSALGYVYAIAGKKDEAQKIIVQLKSQSKQNYVPPYNLAIIYAGLGEKDQAFEYLSKESEEGAYYLNLLKVDPELDSLRDDPRYKDLIRRFGMSE